MILYFIRVFVYGMAIFLFIPQVIRLYHFYCLSKYANKYIPKYTREPFIVCGSPYMIVEMDEPFYEKGGGNSKPSKIGLRERVGFMCFIVSNIRYGMQNKDGGRTPRAVDVLKLKEVMRKFMDANSGKIFHLSTTCTNQNQNVGFSSYPKGFYLKPVIKIGGIKLIGVGFIY